MIGKTIDRQSNVEMDHAFSFSTCTNPQFVLDQHPQRQFKICLASSLPFTSLLNFSTAVVENKSPNPEQTITRGTALIF